MTAGASVGPCLMHALESQHVQEHCSCLSRRIEICRKIYSNCSSGIDIKWLTQASVLLHRINCITDHSLNLA